MKRENLTRLIESATPEQLRLIARLVLRLSGYADSRITDGPHDGGADLRVQAADGATLPLAVALSIEHDWQKKLREDVIKARHKLAVPRVLFISSRRIPEGTFRPLQVELHDKFGVHVDRLDQQGIADLVMDNRALPELLRALDIDLSSEPQPTNPADRRREAAFAYAFFSPEVRSFREVIREKSLLLALDHMGGTAEISALCSDAARLLGSHIDDAPRLLSDLERLLKQGRVRRVNGSVALSDNEQATLHALRTLRSREEAALRSKLSAHLGALGLQTTDEVLDIALRGLGALMLRHAGAPSALEDIHAQVQRLRRELQAHGLPAGTRGDECLQQLVELARNSPLGDSLATGSLYRTLTNLQRGALLVALDACSIAFVLDASVAIPMLCALFHGHVEQRFFVVAEELYRRANAHGFSIELPRVWLEEMASHLLKARDYQALARAGADDLRLSQNAYVSYYASYRPRGQLGELSQFLTTFGLTEPTARLAAHDFLAARQQIEVAIRRQLVRYGVKIIETPAHPPHMKQADKAWDWARHELNLERRDRRLERHEKQVLAWLGGQAEEAPAHAPLIVTWDRLLRRACPEGAPGGALDPLAVCELLSFVCDDNRPPETARFAGFWLTDLEAEKGALVLDTLVQLEKENLSDARSVQLAREFRTQYIAERHDVSDVSALEQAWRKFREQRR